MNYNKILEREELAETITQTIQEILANIQTPTQKRCIFIYGDVGTGKTAFIERILADQDCDVLRFSNSPTSQPFNVKNLNTKSSGTSNVFSMFKKKVRKLVVTVDGIGTGVASTTDNGKVSSIIKLVRPKRTKRQVTDDDCIAMPMICISGRVHNKKITELMKIAYVFEMKHPTQTAMERIVEAETDVTSHDTRYHNLHIVAKHVKSLHCSTAEHDSVITTAATPQATTPPQPDVFAVNQNTSADDVIRRLMKTPMSISEHAMITSDIDRSVIGMNYHENMIDLFATQNKSGGVSERDLDTYLDATDALCISDFIDRNIFQRQMWQLVDVSSVLKIVYPSNKIFENMRNTNQKHPIPKMTEVRFTKILTKYSSEYSNQQFIQRLCNSLHLDVDSTLRYFHSVFQKYETAKVVELMNETGITKLDIVRMERYLDKCLVVAEVDDAV